MEILQVKNACGQINLTNESNQDLIQFTVHFNIPTVLRNAAINRQLINHLVTNNVPLSKHL